MALIILFALLLTPIAEIAVFMKVGGWVGVWPTLALVLITAVLGTWLLRYQGLTALWRVRQTLDRGEVPVDAVLDGVMLLVAGALLLTPGFVTDGVGLLLFVPQVRGVLKAILRRNMATHETGGGVGGGAVHLWRGSADGPSQQRRQQRGQQPQTPADPKIGPVIEADFIEVPTEEDGKKDKNNGD